MEILIPAVGESVVEALLAVWKKQDGDTVKKDQPLCEIETDKITMEVFAESDGVLHILVPAGSTVPVGMIIGRIDPLSASDTAVSGAQKVVHSSAATSPAVRQAIREQGLTPEQLTGSGVNGRILLEDIKGVASPLSVKSEESPPYAAAPVATPVSLVTTATGSEERVPMSPMRKRIAERLLRARQQTAMLTTFNEADLTALIELRVALKTAGRPVGILPLFVKAVCESLSQFPAVNASIDGDDIVYHHLCNIGIAVAAEKGLVVPVLRNAGEQTVYEIDRGITGFSEKIRGNRLAITDLEGGTFTISNGGTFGSMLSTPIINPPQSGVLGMHAIQDRPVARDGQVVIRPMMYLALSYDHRIIDGREAVGFLKSVRELIEDRRWLEQLV